MRYIYLRFTYLLLLTYLLTYLPELETETTDK